MSTKDKRINKLQQKERKPSVVFSPSDDVIAKAVVLYDFESKSEGDQEITLFEGDKVDILRKYDDGWCWIRCKNVLGWFPLNYLEIEDEDEYLPEDVDEDGTEDAEDGYNLIDEDADTDAVAVMTVKYPFKADDDTELTVSRGETLDVLNMSDKEWYQVSSFYSQFYPTTL